MFLSCHISGHNITHKVTPQTFNAFQLKHPIVEQLFQQLCGKIQANSIVYFMTHLFFFSLDINSPCCLIRQLEAKYTAPPLLDSSEALHTHLSIVRHCTSNTRHRSVTLVTKTKHKGKKTKQKRGSHGRVNSHLPSLSHPMNRRKNSHTPLAPHRGITIIIASSKQSRQNNQMRVVVVVFFWHKLTCKREMCDVFPRRRMKYASQVEVMRNESPEHQPATHSRVSALPPLGGAVPPPARQLGAECQLKSARRRYFDHQDALQR